MLTVVALLIVAAFSTALLMNFHRTRARSTESVRHTVCLNLAEAGIDKALVELRRYPAYVGESGTELGEGRFSVEVLPGAAPGAYRVVSTAVLDEARPTQTRIAALVRFSPGGDAQILEWVEESVR